MSAAASAGAHFKKDALTARPLTNPAVEIYNPAISDYDEEALGFRIKI